MLQPLARTIPRIAAAAMAAWLTATVWAQPAPADLDALRRQVQARFEVMPLREGIALVGRDRERRVEIVDGLVLDAGTPLSGADLRTRLGAEDAALVLRLSYLDNAGLRALAMPPDAAAAPAPTPPSPPLPPPGAADVPAIAPPAPPPAPELRDAVPERQFRRRTGARIAIARSITVEADEEVGDDVVAFGGRVRIAGRVRGEVVAVGSNVELLPTADVRGDITSIGGRVSVAPGARHTGEIEEIGGGAWHGWTWPVFGWSRIDMGGWLTLAGTLVRVMLLAGALALVVVVAGGRVTRIAAAAAAAPLRAALYGVGVQVLFVPALVVLSIALAITIVGIPFVAVLVPAAVAAMFVAMLLGFAGVARVAGGWLAPRLGRERPDLLAAVLLGMALVVLPTLLSRVVGVAPDMLRAVAFALLAVGAVVEYAAWTIGLGAAALTGLGGWATVPPVPPPVPPVPPVMHSPLDRSSPL